ncbi:hypothetical protein [Halorubrum sp. DM2]|uniref:hypothetical protein n=1 Tax=Halorubrum sp. DM2 TaxID=2527867 RepID=UPI0024B68BC9|nr:hypothetical protein [Halorubrum sp. DM2]
MSDPIRVVTAIFNGESGCRERLSETVEITACDGYVVDSVIHGTGRVPTIKVISTTQEPISKLSDPNTTLEIYTTDASSTSVFFDIALLKPYSSDSFLPETAGR